MRPPHLRVDEGKLIFLGQNACFHRGAAWPRISTASFGGRVGAVAVPVPLAIANRDTSHNTPDVKRPCGVGRHRLRTRGRA